MFIFNLPKHYRFLLTLFVLGISLFTSFRLVLLMTNLDKLGLLPDEQKTGLIIKAFIMGFRFDSVVSGYILCVPAILLFAASFYKNRSSRLLNFIYYYCGILYTFSFLICCVDIPYFNHFFSRLTTAVFNWSGEDRFVFHMIAQEKSYLIYLPLFVLTSFIFWFFHFNFIRELLFKKSDFNFIVNIFYFIVCGTLIFICIRGRIEYKSPIRSGTANFSSYAFPNQLGLNPNFTFFRSCLDDLIFNSQELHLMDDEQALVIASDYLNKDLNNYRDAVYTGHSLSNEVNNYNVVLFLMESMSAEKMSLFGSKNKLTPFLDSLSKESYSFLNFYTSGIHTYNGIFSTLYSYPALLKKHPMKVTNIPKMSGFPVTLKQHGYSTVFFTTHDEQFDNMAGFLYANGFENIFSEKDYPDHLVAGATGVPDHVMFEHAVPVLNSFYRKNKPFFAALLTASDHGPYFIPDYISFKAKSSGINNQIVEYADWSLSRFMHIASKEEWYKNTIFVFVADHGAVINPVYDMPLSFHHSPFIIYAPELIKEPREFYELCGQIDVFPTIMDILQIKYNNNTMGISILNQKREFIYFCTDDKIGCLNEKYFYIYRMNGEESLYSYRLKTTEDILFENKNLSAEMQKYAFCMMQSAQYILKEFSSVQNYSIKRASNIYSKSN